MNFVLSSISNYTVFHVLDHSRIGREAEANRDLSLWGKCKKGAFVGFSECCKSLAVAPLIFLICSSVFKKANQEKELERGFKYDYLVLLVLAPLIEEVLFRGVLWDIIHLVQKFFERMLPLSVTKRSTLQWLSSPSLRILVTNTCFAAVHLGNAGDSLSRVGAMTQATIIFLKPTCSILRETTGGVIAPVSSHMINNCLAFVVIKLIKKCYEE